MNHFMLPEPKEKAWDSWGESTRYGSYAMESLINEILKQGGLKRRLELKLFGAGKIYDGQMDVGARNSEWMLNYAKAEGLSVVGRDLGDVYPRKIYYFTESGRVLMKKIERLKNQTIYDRELEYATKLKNVKLQAEEDATLF
jgi:chemotaxis protein CheD